MTWGRFRKRIPVNLNHAGVCRLKSDPYALTGQSMLLPRDSAYPGKSERSRRAEETDAGLMRPDD